MAAVHAAMKRAMASGICMPPRILPVDPGPNGPYLSYDYVLSAAGSDLLVCPVLHRTTVVSCWKIDAATGRFAAHDGALIPGYGVRGAACRDFGYCDPARQGHAGEEPQLIAASFDGARVAVVGSLKAPSIAIFEASSKRLLRRFPYRGEAVPAGLGIANDPAQAFFLRDSVLVVGEDAGPFATVSRFGADGSAFGPIYRGRDHGLNVFEGEVRLRSRTRLAARNNGYLELTFDALSTKTAVRRMPRPPQCTASQFRAAADYLSGYDEQYQDADAERQIGKACLRAIREAKARFWRPIAFRDRGLDHVIAATDRELTLQVRDPATGKVRVSRPLPTCTADGSAAAQGSSRNTNPARK